ncbi:sulfotransferase 1B1-like isoform X2 [Physella acuta]|uniref:sulfotransferase 1B1-like isoform X2 n=1 Tax=Physella acuta TaxID=109671 RepID=UPI0027DD4659|nr:sulfotransferase 1B1-like isoform X2 [Physella acuta]
MCNMSDKTSTMSTDSGTVHNLPDSILKKLPKLSSVTDRFGNTFHFGNAGGFWHPPFPLGADTDYRTHLRNITDMEIRPDDVMICSYPKTGLHWQMEIMAMLMQKTGTMDTETEEKLCFLDAKPVPSFTSRPSPRLIVTHVPFRYLPKQALEKKIKIIYLDRNPKDVLVSYYNHMHKHVSPLHYPGTFEHFVYQNLEVGYFYGDMFSYLLEWQEGIDAHPEVPIYVSMYEELKLDERKGVKKLNKFLDTGCSEELCEEIADTCSFGNMKQFKEMTSSEMLKSLFRNNKNNFYRKGDVGDWKNWFTVALNEEFDREYKKHMSGYRTLYKYTLQ